MVWLSISTIHAYSSGFNCNKILRSSQQFYSSLFMRGLTDRDFIPAIDADFNKYNI